jgi:hypothetical protein
MLHPQERRPGGKGKMEKQIKVLLSALRQAVNEAILGSHDVNAALAALGRTGRCPTLAVDVSLEKADALAPDTADMQVETGDLVLTAADEEFLQSLGIAVETGAAVPARLR